MQPYIYGSSLQKRPFGYVLRENDLMASIFLVRQRCFGKYCSDYHGRIVSLFLILGHSVTTSKGLCGKTPGSRWRAEKYCSVLYFLLSHTLGVIDEGVHGYGGHMNHDRFQRGRYPLDCTLHLPSPQPPAGLGKQLQVRCGTSSAFIKTSSRAECSHDALFFLLFSPLLEQCSVQYRGYRPH